MELQIFPSLGKISEEEKSRVNCGKMQKNEHKENLLFILKQVVILWLRDRTTSGEKSKKARKIKEKRH